MPDGERLDAGGRFQNVIAVAFVDISDGTEHGRFVLIDQDGLGAAAIDRGLGGDFGEAFGYAVVGRKENSERGTLSDVGLHFDPSLMPSDDAVHRSQSDAAAFAKLLGGKKRFKEPSKRCLVHAAAVIGQAQADE